MVGSRNPVFSARPNLSPDPIWYADSFASQCHKLDLGSSSLRSMLTAIGKAYSKLGYDSLDQSNKPDPWTNCQ